MGGPVVEEFESTQDDWGGAIAFLDRDGVLNHGSPNYINYPNELRLLNGVKDSIERLKKMNFKIVIVTNQSAIMRGLWDEERLFSIHEQLRKEIGDVDMIVTCPHRTRDRCNCRKPKPGMLIEASRRLRGKFHNSVNWFGEKPQPINELDLMVGDRDSDMGAGWAVGARLFQVNENLGISSVISRIEEGDEGDDFSPV